MSNYIFYTDGAYASSRNQGGIGIVCIKDGKCILEYSKGFKDTTNNRMEMEAAMFALRCIQKPVDSITIYTDSMYVIGCATKGWKRKKNVELWEKFDKEYSRALSLCPIIEFKHVKGHSRGDTEESKWNNVVDKLAVKGSQEELCV